jgi:radical SAM protein with 4Fe4S-binding SPASM domain
MACGDCIAHQIGSSEFLQDLASREPPGGFPLAGSLELTLDCNLWCRHCYIRYPGAVDGEMTTAQVLAVLDKLADRGVLSLLLTGGEIFARPDFREIYLYAKRKGFLLTLFTNATLVDEALCDLLYEWPPRRIEITVYGHTEASYERVTGVKGSFANFRRGIDLLLSRKLPAYLKMMVLRSNIADLADVRAWAAQLGLPFRCDGVVNPRLDGHRGPLRERLDPEDVVRVQGTGPEEREEFTRLRDLARSSRHDGRLFRCGAGIRTFHVDPRGQMHPCMMWRSTPYEFLREASAAGWEEHVGRLRESRVAEGTGCTSCANSLACGNCGATSLLETGSAGKNVDYYCDIGRAREKLLDIVRIEKKQSRKSALAPQPAA